MNADQFAYLHALNIPVWQLKQAVTTNAPTDTQAWDALKAAVVACTLCPLSATRTQTVFGVGNPKASLMIIGEAPGAQEDLRGEPFVGRAGGLLNAMLTAIGLERKEVYIANIVKCRPPSNRDPELDEMACCSQYLRQQIALVQPRLLLAVGRIAAQTLLNSNTPVSRLRGTLHRYEEIPLIVSFHPAYLLRKPSEKAKAFLDWQSVVRHLSGS